MRACLGCLLAVLACGDDGGGTTDDGGTDDGETSQPTNVTLTLTNRPDDAGAFTFVVAYQDGSAPWMVAPAPNGDAYTFPINSASYSVAWTCVATQMILGNAASIRTVTIARFAISERTELTMSVPPRCSDRVTNVALMGNVANLGTGGNFLVAFGERLGIVNPSNGNYRIETPTGTHDLLVMRLQTGLGAGERVVDRVAVVRNLAVTAAMTRNIDFATSAATQSFPVTINATGRLNATTALSSAGGTNVDIVDLGSTPFESRALAAAQAVAGDVYDQAIVVSANGQTAAVIDTTTTPAAQTWAAPTPLGGAIATIPSSTPYAQISSTWASYTGAVGYLWQATQNLNATQCGGSMPCSTVWTTLLSPGSVGAMPAFQMPDLSALAGWSAALQPITGVMMTGFAAALTSSIGATDFPPVSPAPTGTQRTIVRSDFTVTP